MSRTNGHARTDHEAGFERLEALAEVIAEAVQEARAELRAKGVEPVSWKFPPDEDDLAGIVKSDRESTGEQPGSSEGG